MNLNYLDTCETLLMQNKEALDSIDRPPIIPRLPKLGKIQDSIKDEGAGRNSLRRSKTWKSLKKISDQERASALVLSERINLIKTLC